MNSYWPWRWPWPCYWCYRSWKSQQQEMVLQSVQSGVSIPYAHHHQHQRILAQDKDYLGESAERNSHGICQGGRAQTYSNEPISSWGLNQSNTYKIYHANSISLHSFIRWHAGVVPPYIVLNKRQSGEDKSKDNNSRPANQCSRANGLDWSRRHQLGVRKSYFNKINLERKDQWTIVQ